MAYSREEFNSYVENDLTQKKSRFPWGPALGIGIPVGGFLIGSMRTKSGGRVWDHFYKGLQHLEGAMPMGFAATFHGSEFMSPLAAPKSFHLSPEDHPELFKSKKFRYYLSEVTGKRVSELKKLGAFEKGVSWNQGSGYLGDLSVTGGPTIGTNVAALSTGPRRKGTALEWFARVSGLDDASFFTNLDEKKGLRPAWMPAGAGGSKGKLAGRYANSVFSWAMGRMNLLLTSPFDLEVMQDFVSKVPLLRKLNLGVKPGTGAQMLWRYTKKAGVALGAYHLLKYGDYLAREHGTPAAVAVGAAVGAGAGLAIGLRAAKGRPGRYALIGAGVGAALGLGPFRHGPISGLAELYAGVQTNRAGVSTGLGFSEGKRKTEDYFPGLTKPTTLVGMAAMGLVLGGAWNWSQKMTLVKELSGKGIPPGSGGAPGKGAVKGVYELADKQIADKAEAIHDSLKAIASKQKGVSKIVTQIRQRMVGTRKGKEFSAAGAGKYAAVGAGIYTAAAAVGSAVAGDYAGAALQTVASVGAAVAYAKKGPTLALAILALPFLRTKESPEELKRVYSGEEQVAVRSGRWWEAGRTPYEGGRAYYRPHRVAMMRSGSHEAALYGSESKYWETDPVLHPLRFLFNPYERENLMWEQGYKYPVSKTPFEDFPVLGPVMAATIGRIIKPPRFQGRDQWLPEELEEGPRGMRETPGDEPIQRVGLRGTISEQFYRLTELAGLPGFALSAVKGKVTGSEGFFEGRRWATASQVSGVQPAYWSLDIGGAALLSESVRRYIPNRRSSIEEYNPLSSGLPSWLPGPDSQYFLDFSKADIYGKVKEPWARLPGPGYSQLHPELKGVDPEQYSPYHRYRVLADVAPWSREYGAYNRVMSKYMGEGRLTPEQMLEIQATRKRVLEVKKARDFQPYMYDSDAIQKMTVRVTGELEPGVYTTNAFGEAPIVMAGVNTSELSLASVARQRGSAANAQVAMRQGAAKRVELSDYLRSYIHPGAEVDIFVHKDPSLMMEYSDEGKPQVQAIISAAGRNINRELLERGLAQAAETSVTLDAKMAVGPVERGFGAVWERFTHGAETPMESFTPLAPIAKFVHQRSALEEYQRTEVYGKDVALWQTPVKSFLAPGFSTMAHWAGWRGLPGEVRERYMVEEYFDRLEYMKYKRLESEARARGEGQVAAQYSTQLARTKVGADLYSKWGPLMALSTKEKSYFREFVEAPTAAERREISRIVSPQMREILHAQWGQRAADAARARMEAGAPQEGGDLASMNRFYAMQRSSEARQRAIQQSNSEMPVPAPSWIGWDPKAEMEDYKVKTVIEQGLNPVSFGIWGGDLARVARRPWTHPISVAVQGEPNEMVSPGALRSNFNMRMGRAGHRPPSAFLSSAGDNDIEVRSPGYDRLNRYAGPRGDDTIMQF